MLTLSRSLKPFNIHVLLFLISEEVLQVVQSEARKSENDRKILENLATKVDGQDKRLEAVETKVANLTIRDEDRDSHDRADRHASSNQHTRGGFSFGNPSSPTPSTQPAASGGFSFGFGSISSNSKSQAVTTSGDVQIGGQTQDQKMTTTNQLMAETRLSSSVMSCSSRPKGRYVCYFIVEDFQKLKGNNRSRDSAVWHLRDFDCRMVARVTFYSQYGGRAFGAAGGGACFGGSSGFGQSSNPFGSVSSSFGQSAFGSSQSTGGFGQSYLGFGQPAPSFGQSSTGFGQPAPSFGQSSTGFGQPVPSFGTSVPAFGQNTERNMSFISGQCTGGFSFGGTSSPPPDAGHVNHDDFSFEESRYKDTKKDSAVQKEKTTSSFNFGGATVVPKSEEQPESQDASSPDSPNRGGFSFGKPAPASPTPKKASGFSFGSSSPFGAPQEGFGFVSPPGGTLFGAAAAPRPDSPGPVAFGFGNASPAGGGGLFGGAAAKHQGGFTFGVPAGPPLSYMNVSLFHQKSPHSDPTTCLGPVMYVGLKVTVVGQGQIRRPGKGQDNQRAGCEEIELHHQSRGTFFGVPPPACDEFVIHLDEDNVGAGFGNPFGGGFGFGFAGHNRPANLSSRWNQWWISGGVGCDEIERKMLVEENQLVLKFEMEIS